MPPVSERGTDPGDDVAGGGADLVVVVNFTLHQGHAREAGGEIGRGARQDVLDRAGLRGAAGDDDDDIVRQRPQVERVMRDHRDGPPSEAVGEEAADRGSHLDIEGGQGFVEQDEFGIHRERAGQGDALRLPAGQLVRAAIGEVRAAHGVELGAGAGESIAAAQPAGPGAVRDVVQGREVGEQAGALLERHHAAAVRGDVVA